MSKKQCNKWFSETIRENMIAMGKEKTRPQIIAISAKKTMVAHPECTKYLYRPLQKIQLDEKHWIFWSSKSIRLYRNKPCVIRIFFSKRQPLTLQWKKVLQSLIFDKTGVHPRFSTTNISYSNDDGNFFEIPITNPKIILALLSNRVASFLD